MKVCEVWKKYLFWLTWEIKVWCKISEARKPSTFILPSISSTTLQNSWKKNKNLSHYVWIHRRRECISRFKNGTFLWICLSSPSITHCFTPPNILSDLISNVRGIKFDPCLKHIIHLNIITTVRPPYKLLINWYKWKPLEFHRLLKQYHAFTQKFQFSLTHVAPLQWSLSRSCVESRTCS